MTGVFVKDVAVTSNQRTGASSQGDFPLLRVRLVTPRFMAGWRTVSCQKVAFQGAGMARCRANGGGGGGVVLFFLNLEENATIYTISVEEDGVVYLSACAPQLRPGQPPPRAPLEHQPELSSSVSSSFPALSLQKCPYCVTTFPQMTHPRSEFLDF